MLRTTLIRASAAMVLGVAVTFVLSGCGGKGVGPAQQPMSSAPAGQAIARMTADQKRSTIATTFPIEIPVPQGRVVRGEAQGPDVWDYQLEIPAAPADVEGWYTTWYPKAEWRLVSNEVAGEGRRLVFVKGGYAADVTVTPGDPTMTKVTAIVGMGGPVLNTQ